MVFLHILLICIAILLSLEYRVSHVFFQNPMIIKDVIKSFGDRITFLEISRDLAKISRRCQR